MSKINNTDALIADKLLRMELANIRKAKHLTQKDLSRLSGLSESCISNIESGEDSSPTLRSLIRYATALEIEFFIKTSKEDDVK
jgi:transcriptional regulator with XRE-family HTH domain